MAEQQPVPIVLSPEESALLAVQGELAEELGTVVFEPPSDGELLPMSEDELAFADRVGYARQVRVDQISTYERIAERRTDVAHDNPARRPSRQRHFVQGVVGVLEIGAVEHQQDDQQSLVGPAADERIALPRPFTRIA